MESFADSELIPTLTPTLTGTSMKKLISLMALAFAFSMSMSPLVHAADGDAKTAQQSKMGACNKDAEGKKGDERKAFMKDCLSAKKEAAGPAAACEKASAEKKLAGAAKTSFEKKCLADAGGMAAAPSPAAVCEKASAEKKLAGAAKASFEKKCLADAGDKTMAKPMAAVTPAAKK
jgi:hypothetical protein